MNNFDLLNVQCLNYQARKLTRLLATYFDNVMLARCGMRYTQFSFMVGIASSVGGTMSSIAREMHMDRTTISRNLKPLIERGWVEIGSTNDMRAKAVKLTAKGTYALEEAVPIWQEGVNCLSGDVVGEEYEGYLRLTREIIAKLSLRMG